MKIIGLSGKKQAGKTTVANIIHGIVLKERDMIRDWTIDEKGQLLIKTFDNKTDSWGYFYIERKDEEFLQFAEYNMWPYVKLYSFADQLKWMCHELFNIPYECLYGTNEQKNQPQEHLLWENMPGVISSGMHNDPSGPMSAREFMQFLGTDVMRKMWEPVWTTATLNKIQREQPVISVIADVRFPNEARAVEDAGGIVVRLTREPFADDQHISENALNDYPFKHYIENKYDSLATLMLNVKSFYSSL